MNKEADQFCQACLSGDLNTVQSMLKENADLANAYGRVHPDHREFMAKEKADSGWSALHLAAHYGQLAVVKVLVHADAKLNVKANNGIGNTPLMAAVAGGQIEIVRFLLENGADPKLTDKSNATALKLAQIDKKIEIATVLKEYR